MSWTKTTRTAAEELGLPDYKNSSTELDAEYGSEFSDIAELSGLRVQYVVVCLSCVCVFRERKRPSAHTSARQMLRPEYRQSSTGGVVTNAMLPRRNCLKAL